MPNVPAPKGTAGTSDKVPCPWCNAPNDFRDVMNGHAGQALIDTGDSLKCDHCDGEMTITAMRPVTIIHLVRGQSPPKQNARVQQRQMQPKQGGLLQKLLGKG